MRVLVADDHEAIHFLAAHLIKAAFPDLQEVHAARNAEELLRALDNWPIELVVLDLVMPGPVKRIGLIQVLQAHHRQPRILVYSGNTHAPMVAAAMAAGAAGYVPKGASASSLVLAMQTIAGGGTYVDPSVAPSSGVHPWHLLNVAERDVLRHIAAGQTIKQIAAASERAYSTIASLRMRGMEKLGLCSQEELSAYFYQNGLDYELDEGFRPGLLEARSMRPLEQADQVGTRGNVVPLRPGNLAARDLEVVEVIALMLLRLDEVEARKNMRLTSLTFAELEQRYGRPEIPAQSGGWRFPVQRWSVGGFRLLAVDVGTQRAVFSIPSTEHRIITQSTVQES